jgi:hypothetical protein
LESGFQDERAARLGHVLRKREAAGRTRSFDYQSVTLLHVVEIRRIAADFFRSNFGAAGESEFRVVLAVHDDARHSGTQNKRNELRELAVTEHGRFAELFGVNLFQNLASRRKRFHKHSLLVAYRIWDKMQILERQRQKLGERAIV